MLEEQLYANNETFRMWFIIGAIVLNFAYYAYTIKNRPDYLLVKKTTFASIEKTIRGFGGISFFFSLWFIQIGFDVEKQLFRMFGQTSDAIWLAFSIGILYSIFFNHAVFHILLYYPDGLKLIRIALITYIPVNYSIHIFTCIIHSILSDQAFLLSEYFKADMTAHYWFDGLYCIGYLLYFSLSKNIKVAWQDLAYFQNTPNKLDLYHD